MPIPVLLVTGAGGAGKTIYLSRLLAARPPGERWAVLVNDFGSAKLDAEPGVIKREVAGCFCCSAQVALRSAVIALLREKPARLLIEASSAAHPQSVLNVLNEPGIASAVALEPTVCVVDPAQAIDARYANLELYREQVKSADVVVLTKCELWDEATRRAAIDALRAIGARGSIE